MSTVENENIRTEEPSTELDKDSSAQTNPTIDTDTASNPGKISEKGTEFSTMKDDECQIEVESKASGAASDTGSHSPASSHYSTHSSGASVIAHSRSTANTPLRDRHGRNSDSGGSSVWSGVGGITTTPLGLVEFDVLRFRNSFLQTVEELKMRRDVDVKKENRIKELIEGKHQLQQKCDDVEQSHAEHLEQCSHQEQEIRKHFTNQIRQFEEDKARQACIEESRLKEVKALKDEIRALQLAKYNVEKKVEEQERQLQVQTLSRESILNEMSGVEGKYQLIMSQVTSTADQMSQLEANVKQAIELNRKLQYVNDHQNCLLAGYKTELEACRQQLVEARVSLADALAERGEREEQTGRKTTPTEQELKMHTELNKQLQVQLSGLREEHQTVLSRLKEAHSLLEKHVEASNKAQEGECMLKEKAEKLEKKKERLEVDLQALQEQLTSQKQEWSTDREYWETKTAEVEQRLKSLQGDYSSLQDAHDQLETKGAARESELKSEIVRLEQQKKDKEKQDGEETRQRIAELEEALKESETHIQEKNILLEDKAVQTVSTACQDSSRSPLKSTPQCNLTTKPESEEATSPTMDLLPVASTTVDTEVVTTSDHVNGGSIQMGDIDCRPVEECSTGGGATDIPSPPRSPLLSPEVILESNTTSPEDKAAPSPVDEAQQFKSTLKLATPRLHLERIQLPLNRENGSSNDVTPESVSGQSCALATEDSSSRETPAPASSSKDVSPLKRKLNEQQQFPTMSDEDVPAKKPKLPTISLPSFKAPQLERSDTVSVNPPWDSQSQPERTPETSSFQPLSQPISHSDKMCEEDNQILSQPSDSMSKRGNIPWRINLPKSFYATKKPHTPKNNTITAAKSESLEPEVSMHTLPSECKNSSKQSVCNKIHSAFPQHLPIHYKLPWSFSEPVSTADKITNSTTTKSASVVGTAPSSMPAKSTLTGIANILPSLTNTELPFNTPCKSPPCIHSQEHSKSELAAHVGPSADQSVPNSPRGSSNFAIVFSEGEDEGDERESKELLSSQMIRQIKKVNTFLKNDRLRRTKVAKL